MFILTYIIVFLIGSIPSGYLIIKKLKGIDIRTVGSGNIGSTNVKRVAGTKIAILTQVCDISKSGFPVLFVIYFSNNISLPFSKEIYISSIAFVSILGHNYTPFLSFNGGKGVNTTLGAFFFIVPIPVLFGVAVHKITKPFISIVAIRSILLGITIPIACIIFKEANSVIFCTILSGILIIYRHKENITQLFSS